ncbi:unnamed protein product [Discula destructiva]
MHLLLLGSTGRTGLLVLQEALKRGHIVAAIVRNPAALEKIASSIYLIIIRGSALDNASISYAIEVASDNGKSQLAVISTLNPRRVSENPWAAAHPTDSPPRMMANSIANIIAALPAKTEGSRKPKVLHLSGLGAGSSQAQAPWVLLKFIGCSNMKLTYEDHEAAEEQLRRAGDKGLVDWVSVRPTRLVNGDERSTAKVWPRERGTVGMMASSSREGVAKFLLDAAEGSEWDGQTPIVID